MVIVPSIDLRAGKVVRLRQGNYADQIDYAADPVETAKSFAEAGAHWIHVVDLDGAAEGRVVQLDLIEQIVDALRSRNTAGVLPPSVQVGGGVRDQEDVAELLDLGVARVVIGTARSKRGTGSSNSSAT